MSRRLAREKTMQCLFSITVGNTPEDIAIEILDEENISKQDKVYAQEVIKGVLENLVELDNAYVNYLKDWQIDRLANVDKTLLRIAVYEMLHMPEIPPTVAINEAVELAKIFSGDESPKFINAVLDSIRKEISKEAE